MQRRRPWRRTAGTGVPHKLSAPVDALVARSISAGINNWEDLVISHRHVTLPAGRVAWELPCKRGEGPRLESGEVAVELVSDCNTYIVAASAIGKGV
jgi:hypothetical protein